MYDSVRVTSIVLYGPIWFEAYMLDFLIRVYTGDDPVLNFMR